MADAIAKFWVMPRTGTALSPVDSTSAGVTATKGFNLAADLIGGLPELDDQVGGAMVGTSGQSRSERVSTAVRDLQSFDVSFRDNRDPHAASPAMVGAGTVFSRRIIDSRPDNAAPWRVEIEYGSGETVSYFDVQFGNRKTIPCRTELEVSADRACDLTNVYGPLRRTYRTRLPGLVRGRLHSASSRCSGKLLLGWEHPLVEWARRSTQVERVSAHGFDSRSAFNWASSARFSSGVSFLRKVSISRLIFFRASSNIFFTDSGPS